MRRALARPPRRPARSDGGPTEGIAERTRICPRAAWLDPMGRSAGSKHQPRFKTSFNAWSTSAMRAVGIIPAALGNFESGLHNRAWSRERSEEHTSELQSL